MKSAEVGIEHHEQTLQLLLFILAERMNELGTFRPRQAVEHLRLRHHADDLVVSSAVVIRRRSDYLLGCAYDEVDEPNA